jgi:hypothetical protein
MGKIHHARRCARARTRALCPDRRQYREKARIAGALEHLASAARATSIEVSRGSFAAEFTSVLIVAGGISALGALLTALLVSTVETGATRLARGAACRLPGVD